VPKSPRKSSGKLRSLRSRPAKDTDKVRGGGDIEQVVQLVSTQIAADTNQDLRDMLQSTDSQLRKSVRS
jgi:hypothetical protein